MRDTVGRTGRIGQTHDADTKGRVDVEGAARVERGSRPVGVQEGGGLLEVGVRAVWPDDRRRRQRQTVDEHLVERHGGTRTFDPDRADAVVVEDDVAGGGCRRGLQRTPPFASRCASPGDQSIGLDADDAIGEHRTGTQEFGDVGAVTQECVEVVDDPDHPRRVGVELGEAIHQTLHTTTLRDP